MTSTSADATSPNSAGHVIHGKHDDLTQKIIGLFYEVYNELGYGFLESVYSGAMCVALRQAGLKAEREMPIPVSFRGEVVGLFKADLIVNDAVLIELKACEALIRQHESQVLNYLRATKIEVALLMNFGPAPRFKRLVLNNEFKRPAIGIDGRCNTRSVESVLIGVSPSSAAEVVR